MRVLNHEELQSGDVSLEYVSRLMHRRFSDAPTLRKILQTIWYQVNNGQEIYVIGVIQDDGTVRGGTGWGAEFAKLCNKPLCVFDEEKGFTFTMVYRDRDKVPWAKTTTIKSYIRDRDYELIKDRAGKILYLSTTLGGVATMEYIPQKGARVHEASFEAVEEKLGRLQTSVRKAFARLTKG